MEENEVKKVEKINKLKMNSNQICALVVALLFLVLGFLVGSSIDNINIQEDYTVVLENEKQIFRNRVGKKLDPIEYNGEIYIPVSEIGTYMGYMPIYEENKLTLKSVDRKSDKILTGLNTETYDGVKITDSVFSESDYSIFVLWGTWCKDCEGELPSIALQNDYFQKNNIQLISVETSIQGFSNKEKVTENDINKVYDKDGGIDFKYYLYRDTVININLIGNTTFIPKLVIFDNEGNLIKIIDYTITGEELVGIMNGIIGK